MPSDRPDQDPAVVLGERMRLARTRAGLHQRDAAAALNCSVRTLSAWEVGAAKAPAIAIPELASLYGVTCEWLLAPNVPFRALVDEKSEQDALRSRDTRVFARHANTLSVIVSEHLRPVSSPDEWRERMQAVYEHGESLRRADDGRA